MYGRCGITMLTEMKFEIYYETYCKKENGVVDKVVGISSGMNFEEACYKLSLKDKDFAREFDLRYLTFRGKELFGHLLK